MERHRVVASFLNLVAASIAKCALVQVLTTRKQKIYMQSFFPPVLLFETVPGTFRGHIPPRRCPGGLLDRPDNPAAP